MGNTVSNTIKYALSSNIISLDDLLYDNSFVKCTKTGSACDTNCKQFKFDDTCKYSKFECRYLTAGQLWFLLRIAEDRIIDDRDFDAILHTGKSIKKDSKAKSTGVVTKRVRSENKKSNDTTEKKASNKKSQKQKNSRIKSIILNRINENRKKSTEWMSNALSNSSEEPPTHVFNIFEQLKDDNKVFNDFKLNDYFFIITDFIEKGETAISVDDLEYVIDFLLFDYVKKSYDFPLDKNINPDKIADLYEKTSTFDDNNCEKWTPDRYKKMESVKDEYLKTIYYDSEFYGWFLYGVLNEQKRSFKDLTNLCVYVRYIIRQLLLKYKYYYCTNEIILLRTFTDENLKNLKIVFKILKNVYEKNTESKIENLFIQEQLDNSYAIVDNSKEFKTLHLKFKDKLKETKYFRVVGNLIDEKYFKKINLFDGE